MSLFGNLENPQNLTLKARVLESCLWIFRHWSIKECPESSLVTGWHHLSISRSPGHSSRQRLSDEHLAGLRSWRAGWLHYDTPLQKLGGKMNPWKMLEDAGRFEIGEWDWRFRQANLFQMLTKANWTWTGMFIIHLIFLSQSMFIEIIWCSSICCTCCMLIIDLTVKFGMRSVRNPPTPKIKGSLVSNGASQIIGHESSHSPNKPTMFQLWQTILEQTHSPNIFQSPNTI